mgnify:CR=1 FL=1
MPFSLRLDPETEAKIRKLTAATGRSKSSVVREAVAQYSVDQHAPIEPDSSAFHRLSPFIGAVSTDGCNYSEETHTKYRAVLQKKHRAKRTSVPRPTSPTRPTRPPRHRRAD